MPRSIRSITVNFNAGTAKANADVEKFKANLRDIGPSGTTGIRAIGTELRLLEGNFTNNIRGVETFLSSFPALRQAMVGLFPLAGGLAFTGIVAEATEKIVGFFSKVREAPERIDTAWRSLSGSLRLTNDDLAVANARLSEDIAKLEGKHENTLALALAEARKQADSLADSLDRAIEKMQTLLKDEAIGGMERVLGQAGTKDLQDLLKNLRKDVAAEAISGSIKIHQAKGDTQIKAAQDQLEAALKARYDWYLGALREMLGKAQVAQGLHDHTKLTDITGFPNLANAGSVPNPAPDQTQRIHQLNQMIDALSEESLTVSDQFNNSRLAARKDELQASRDNAQAERPFEDRMAKIKAEIAGVQAKMEAIGKPEAARVVAEAFSEAAKAIEETNKALERNNKKMDAAQEAEMRATELTLAKSKAESEWVQKFTSETQSINSRIAATNALTEAIGKGYAATKKANVEAQVMEKMGAGYGRPEDESFFMEQTLRNQFGEQYDTEHAKTSGESLLKLQDEIALERQLAAAQKDGAEAVAQATLTYKMQTITRDNDAASAWKLMAAEIELFNAQRSNKASEEVAKLDEKIAATERLTQATLKGAAAVRAATLEHELEKIDREGGSPADVSARKAAAGRQSMAEYNAELSKIWASENPLQGIDDQIEKLKDAKTAYGDLLGIDIKLRDLENERLKIAVQQTLQLRKASDGVKAFFLEMQTDAESAASIIYTALNSAVSGTADNLAKMAMGERPKKGGWGEMFGKEFQGIGEKTASSAIKSMEQAGLGRLGKLLGIKPPPTPTAVKRPTGNPGDPVHVVDDSSGGEASSPGDLGRLPAMPNYPVYPLYQNSRANLAAQLGGMLGRLFGTGGGGSGGAAGESVSSSISFGGGLANGGFVTPDKAYLVGEEGPEILTATTGRIISHTEMARKFGGDRSEGGHTTYIDARGSDLGVINRIAQLEEVRNRRVVTQSVQAMREHEMRQPMRRGGK